MKRIFADTFYWIALFNPKDAWHSRAMAFADDLKNYHLVTTEEILSEFLTYYSGAASHLRQQAVKFVWPLQSNPNITVITQSHVSFMEALKLYDARPDKAYSLTDCNAMQTMRDHGITEVLSNDRHFAQEGFRLIFTDH